MRITGKEKEEDKPAGNEKRLRVYRNQVRWSEDAGTETRGSEGKDKRGEVLILSAS